MAYAAGKRSYSLRRDFHVLAREQRVTKILGSDAFRAELEDILQSQLEGTRSPPKTRALHALQENVVPAVPGMAAAGRHAAVLPINDLRGALSSRYAPTERQLRCKLASLCRLVDWFQWSQLVQNHVSAREVGDRDQFIMNPFGLLYSEVTASSIVSVTNGGDVIDPGSTQLGVNRTGLQLHSTIYAVRRDVRCIVHLHTVAGAAVSVQPCGLLPLSQEALNVGKVSYHTSRRGLTDEQKKEFVKNLGKNKALILRNHGLIAMGCCVEECFYIMYNLIQACQIQVTAMAVGLSNLVQISPENAEREKAERPSVWAGNGEMEFEALMRMLDNKGYNTGYRHRGMSLLQPHASGRREMTADTQFGDERKTVKKDSQRARNRRGRIAGSAYSTSCSSDDEIRKNQCGGGVWSFLDADRSHAERPLTKNTKIGIQLKSESRDTQDGRRDPWDFLSPKDGATPANGPHSTTPPHSLHTPTAPPTHTIPHTHTGPHTHTPVPTSSPLHNPDGSVKTEKSTPSSATSQSSRRKRRRKKRPSQSTHTTTSPPPPPPPTPHTPPQSPNSHHHAPPSSLANKPASLPIPPPSHLTPLQLAQYTAERVAWSTGRAVQKMALRKLTSEPPERALSEPNLSLLPGVEGAALSRDCTDSMLRHDQCISTDSMLHHYSSGELNSESGAGGQQTHTRESGRDGVWGYHTPPSHHEREARDLISQKLPHLSPTAAAVRDPATPPTPPPSHKTPSPAHTPPPHQAAIITYPDGCSSAERASYLARIVASSTRSAVQKLSDTLSERGASLSHSLSPSLSPPTGPPHASTPSVYTPTLDN